MAGQQPGGKKARKHGRNYRHGNENRSHGSPIITYEKKTGTKYRASGGEARHARKAADNCGCDKPILHMRANRADHERENVMRANGLRQQRADADHNPALMKPRGRRGPAQQPPRKVEKASDAAA